MITSQRALKARLTFQIFEEASSWVGLPKTRHRRAAESRLQRWRVFGHGFLGRCPGRVAPRLNMKVAPALPLAILIGQPEANGCARLSLSLRLDQKVLFSQKDCARVTAKRSQVSLGLVRKTICFDV
jgi:hypothetical protein